MLSVFLIIRWVLDKTKTFSAKKPCENIHNWHHRSELNSDTIFSGKIKLVMQCTLPTINGIPLFLSSVDSACECVVYQVHLYSYLFIVEPAKVYLYSWAKGRPLNQGNLESRVFCPSPNGPKEMEDLMKKPASKDLQTCFSFFSCSHPASHIHSRQNCYAETLGTKIPRVHWWQPKS